MNIASNVFVFAGDDLLYRTHPADAARLLRDGLAQRRGRGHGKLKALDLIQREPIGTKQPASLANPRKYTYIEALSGPDGVDAHCHSHKPGLAHRRNWPYFRAAVIDCLPSSKQAEIREIFR